MKDAGTPPAESTNFKRNDTMLLTYGSSGPQVRDLQRVLNQLTTQLPRLSVDGFFGYKTYTRVLEFQRDNGLAADGIAGPRTLGLVENLGTAETLPGPPSNVTVESITQQVLGVAPNNGFIPQFVPSVPKMDIPTFRPGDQDNNPAFSWMPLQTARLGVFAAGKAGYERAVVLMLPESGVPRDVVIGVSHQFGQSKAHYDALGWNNPRSAPLINFVLLRHILKRWGPQVITAPRPTAFLHIIRAGDGSHELGPFQNDGPFVKEVLEQLVAMTNRAFDFSSVQAFTFSNGIFDFNDFLDGISKSLNVTRVISMDPRFAFQAKRPNSSTVLRQYLSGTTYRPAGPRPGFEYLPYTRWENEDFHYMYRKTPSKFQYLHNHALPMYTLRLGLTV